MTSDERAGQLIVDKDREYAMKFWATERPESLFEEMITAVEQVGDKAKLQISTTGYKQEQTEELRQYLSAYRRLAAAIGVDLGQFLIDSTNAYAVARVVKSQDKQIVANRKDGEHGIPYLHKVLQTPNLLHTMMDNIRIAADSGVYYRFAGSPLDQDDKTRLSAARIIGRAMGYKMGTWQAHPRVGTAGIKIMK